MLFFPSFLSSVKLRHYSSKMGFEPVEINLVWQESANKHIVSIGVDIWIVRRFENVTIVGIFQ